MRHGILLNRNYQTEEIYSTLSNTRRGGGEAGGGGDGISGREGGDGGEIEIL